MKKTALLLSLLLASCTSDPIGPDGLYPGYSLLTINGQVIPAPDNDIPDGAEIISASLAFPRPDRSRGEQSQLVSYTRWIRMADQTVERLTLQLDYTVEDGELRINLCPPLALCILTTELIGQVDARELLLTHFLAGQAQAVYRYEAALPE
ncbi:MAG: hypothetical protein AB7R55_10530 [Gemmatimonadales bacterium]